MDVILGGGFVAANRCVALGFMYSRHAGFGFLFFPIRGSGP